MTDRQVCAALGLQSRGKLEMVAIGDDVYRREDGQHWRRLDP